MIISDFKLLEKIIKPYKIYNLYYFKSLTGVSIDSRSIKRGEIFIAIKGRHHNGHEFIPEAIRKGAKCIIAQEYLPSKSKVPFFLVEDTYNSIESLAAYIRKQMNPFVFGITGSIGKTMTKEMLAFLLENDFKVLKNKKTENNVLGVAKTIFSLKDEKVMILELGTNAKGEIGQLAKICMPDVGIITFIKPVHLQGLGDLKGVLKEKTSLLKVSSRIKAILNKDDPYLAKIKAKAGTYWFGKDQANNLFATLVEKNDKEAIFLVQGKYKLRLSRYRQGFISNALAAILGAHLLGINLKKLVRKMNRFKGFLPMRMEMKRVKGFLVLNDAYNSNPYSFSQALNILKEYPLRKVAIVGDMLELGPKAIYYHKQLAKQIINSDFDYCFSYGKYSACINDALQKLGHKNSFRFDSYQQIARAINKRIGKTSKLKKRYLIFLKGSRKMELEKVIKYLK